MLIRNIIESNDVHALTTQPLLGDHARLLVHLQIPAGRLLKPHASKVDVLLIGVKGDALFTLWEGDKVSEYEIHPHDVVAFKANQMHSILAVSDFSAFVIK